MTDLTRPQTSLCARRPELDTTGAPKKVAARKPKNAKAAAKLVKPIAPEVTIISYKGFDANWKCLGFQYEIGQTYIHQGEAVVFKSGFHACEYPLDIFKYYPPSANKFAVVEQAGNLSRHNDGSAVASSKITIKAEISFVGIIKAAIEYTTKRCNPIDPKSPTIATGYRGVASASGDRGVASATGTQSAASATGYRGVASASGDRGVARATGTQSAAFASGDRGIASTSGNCGAAIASGYQGAAIASGSCGTALATGFQGAASASGDRSIASAMDFQSAARASGTQSTAIATGTQSAAFASGYQGVASATGYRGVASATGYRGIASASGYQGVAIATGDRGVASATGAESRVSGVDGNALFLVFRDSDHNIVHAKAAIVGRDGIKANTFYTLNRDGRLIEVHQ